MPIKPIQRRNVADVVYDQMQQLIASGEWKPGDRIPSELELTELFGVSRVSIRAALQRLEGQGVLQRRPGRGTVINALSTSQVMNQLAPHLLSNAPDLISLNEFREILECGAVRLAARRRTPEQLDAMEQNYSELCIRAAAGEDTSVLDVALHCLLAEASGNALMVQTFDIVYDCFLKNMYTIKAITGDALSIAYHRQLIDAVRAGDGAQAKRVMHSHLEENAKCFLAAQAALEKEKKA